MDEPTSTPPPRPEGPGPGLWFVLAFLGVFLLLAVATAVFVVPG